MVPTDTPQDAAEESRTGVAAARVATHVGPVAGRVGLRTATLGLACCAVEVAAARAEAGAAGAEAGAAGAAATDVGGAGAAEVKGESGGSRAAAGPPRTGGPGEVAAGAAGAASRERVFVVAGTVTDAMAPLVRAEYESARDEARAAGVALRVVSFGSCANSGGPYWDSYSVTKGVDQLLPVDVAVPGCPPRPEQLAAALALLAGEPDAGAPARTDEP